MKVSVPKKRETVVSLSQKFETVLCKFLAMAGYAATKRKKKKDGSSSKFHAHAPA